MLDMILPFISNQEPRSLPPYQAFLNSQKNLIQTRYKDSLETIGHTSKGVKLLKYILQFVDFEYLDRKVNGYERYNDYIRFIYRDMLNTFDRAGKGRAYINLFFPRLQFITEEYLIPIADYRSPTNLPLYTEDWSIWKKINPLRIWDHDSLEYNINIINDQYHFRYMPPSYCVELLDVVALLFKYYIWIKKHQIYENNDIARVIPMEYFIHKYIFCPTMWDLANLWLLHLICKLLITEDFNNLSDFDSSQLESDSMYGRVSLNSRKAFEYLFNMIKLNKHLFKANTLLSSKLLLDSSINDKVLYTEQYLELPGLKKYNYLRWLRDRKLIRICTYVWQQGPNKYNWKSKQRVINRIYNRYYNTRFWNMCNSYLLSNYIEKDFTEFGNSILT